MTAFDAATAGRFARRALENVECEYPNLPHHVLASAADVVPARVLHPAFYGSYDWHSSVHMHWLLVRARRLHPALEGRHAIDAVLERHFDAASLAVERAYLDRPHTAAFERTYGWAWLLKLADELARSGDAQARRWSVAITPLADAFVARYLDYLPRADYPLRHGLHANSAFGLAFALDHAVRAGAPALARACRDAARRWYAEDRDVPAAWEPSGADFLSPALAEADLMRRVLPTTDFAEWLARFLPGLEQRSPSTLFTPAAVRDRADPQIVHLDGLNLSRAWCFRGIACALPRADGRRAALLAAAEQHLAAGLAGLGSSDYFGEHWLATFALRALSG